MTLQIFHTCMYAKQDAEHFSVLEKKLNEAMNITEIKKVKKDISTYLKFLNSVDSLIAKKVPNKFEVVDFATRLQINVFPIQVYYEVVVRELGKE